MPILLKVEPGATVRSGTKNYRIIHVSDLQSVLAKEVIDGRSSAQSELLDIKDLTIPKRTRAPSEIEVIDFEEVSDKDWQEACRRSEVIVPLIQAKRRTKTMVKEAAGLLGVHVSTVYRWIEAYEKGQYRVTALMPHHPSGGEGKTRLDENVENIIKAVLEYLSKKKEKTTVRMARDEIKARCEREGLIAPHYSTVRVRFNRTLIEKNQERRTGRTTKERNAPAAQHFPGADWPLAIIQIDHTKLDIILVDDEYRLPIGRPNITVAMDVNSRVVLGYYYSMDPIGNMSVGACLANAILPKDKLLAKLGITTPWPCWGFPVTIHADNAGEFRGDMLKRVCQEHGMNIVWRPVKKPRYGGHIERLLGTVLNEIHSLPGTTFSNPKEKGAYDSEKESAITVSVFEKWLASLIVEDYHLRIHSTLGMPPIKKYEMGTLGTKDQLGCGLQPRVLDEDRLRLHFTPSTERTIQQCGVQIECIKYHDGVLDRFINAKDPLQGNRKRLFNFKYDPRDISQIYFLDPDLKQYFPIPYSDKSHPAMSLWELRAVRKWMREQGVEAVDEKSIFESRERRMALVEESKRTTQKIRRETQRRVAHAQIEKPSVQTTTVEKPPEQEVKGDCLNIMPFDEIDID